MSVRRPSDRPLTALAAGLAAGVLGLTCLSAPSQAAPGSGSSSSWTEAAARDKAKNKQKAKLRRLAKKPVRVMTRNVYLGANIFRPVNAAQDALEQGLPLGEVLDALAHANDATAAINDRTDFRVRARLLAREIQLTRPDLIGLQEVATWRHGEIQTALGQIGVPNATEVDYDFLELLLAELKKLGLDYAVTHVGQRADVEAPGYAEDGSNRRDLRLTMHDVILHRTSRVKVLGTGNQIYSENLPVTLAGLRMNFDRGFQWADVKIGKLAFRFANTHLESASSDLALAQAKEMAAAVLRPGRTTVMTCDCNSDPKNSSVKSADTVPHKAPYEFLTGAGRFADEWLRYAPAYLGFTSGGQNELVNNATAGWTHRIDLILGRRANGKPLKARRGWMVGTRPAERDRATGLWASDHAGVVLKLKGFGPR